MKFAGDIKVNGIYNKVSILLNTKKLVGLHVSIPVPVIDCSGTGASTKYKMKV